MEEKRKVYRLLVGKPVGKKPLRRPRCRWIDNIKMDILEIRLGCVDWIGLPQNRTMCRTLVKAVMNIRFHKMLGNYQMVAQFVASREELSCPDLVSRNICICIYVYMYIFKTKGCGFKTQQHLRIPY
jgi:hypothetical protein